MSQSYDQLWHFAGQTESLLPPSLATASDIPFEQQTLEQLHAERDYWIKLIDQEGDFVQSNVACAFLRACEIWIGRRTGEREDRSLVA